VIAVLFALAREAGPFRTAARTLPGVSVHVSGVGQRAAREAAQRLVETKPSLVIAAGFCGALAPHLRVGDVLFFTSPPEGEVGEALRAGWVGRASELLSGSPPTRRPQSRAATSPSGGEVKARPRLLTVDHLVCDPAEKRRLSASFDAVDMESAAVEGVCAAAGVPFRAVRAVSDTADTALSPELVRLLAGGNVSVWRACAALVRRPALLREFTRLARDTKIAARALATELTRELEPLSRSRVQCPAK